MRILTSILCLSLSASLAAADTYRWVDKNGSVHYSDQPSPGAERVPLNSAPMPGSVAPPRTSSAPGAVPTRPFVYAGCEISSPNAEQVFFSVNSVSASVNVLPGLQSGHRITMQVNGRMLAEWPPTSSGYLLQNLSRGSYALMAIVVDAAGVSQCTSAVVTFHIRQPSMLKPGLSPTPH